MNPRALVATLLCLSAGGSPWTVAQAQGRAFARTVRQYARTHAFSGTVLVQRGGTTLYHESFGLADRAFSVPVTNATKFKAASITKAFTAVLVLQLAEQGKIDLRAPIRAYLPDYAGEGADKVSIHDLLNHTSGIENFDRIESYEETAKNGIESYQLPPTTDDLLTKFSSGKLGSVMGANTLLLRFLDDDLTVVILSNTNATDIDAFGFFVGRAALD